MRLRWFAVVILAGLGVARAQGPAAGQVVGGSYVNPYFGLTFTWPAMLHPVDLQTLHMPQSGSMSEYFLFGARQGDDHFGMMLLAEKLHVTTQHKIGLRDGDDFLDRYLQALDPEEPPRVLKRAHVAGADGRDYDELEYMDGYEFASAVTTEVGDFLVVYRCDAKTAADLAAMDGAVLATKIKTSAK
jgi:hypothetical protein